MKRGFVTEFWGLTVLPRVIGPVRAFEAESSVADGLHVYDWAEQRQAHRRGHPKIDPGGLLAFWSIWLEIC